MQNKLNTQTGVFPAPSQLSVSNIFPSNLSKLSNEETCVFFKTPTKTKKQELKEVKI